MGKMRDFIASLEIGHKTIVLDFKDFQVSIGHNVDGEKALKYLGEEKLNYIDTHKPLHEYRSMDKVEFIYKRNEKFSKLCGW